MQPYLCSCPIYNPSSLTSRNNVAVAIAPAAERQCPPLILSRTSLPRNVSGHPRLPRWKVAWGTPIVCLPSRGQILDVDDEDGCSGNKPPVHPDHLSSPPTSPEHPLRNGGKASARGETMGPPQPQNEGEQEDPGVQGMCERGGEPCWEQKCGAGNFYCIRPNSCNIFAAKRTPPTWIRILARSLPRSGQ